MIALAANTPAWSGLFAWPWFLLALPLPLLARWLLPPRRAQGAALRVPWGDRLDAIAAAGGRSRAIGGAGVLAWIAWALLCIAAARPQALGPPVAPPQAGRDLMLAVDLSGSMGEVDMELGGRPVDRLTAAKAVLADFLDRRAGDRVGLVVFGERAYALTPMTRDLQSVRAQLEDSVVALAGRETAIGDAIGLATKRLVSARESTPDDRVAGAGNDDEAQVLVLLTDGVNTAGVLDPRKAAELARDAGVRIHTIGFGTDAGAMSLFGFGLPGAGGSGIDEETLEYIASTTGGRYFRARDTSALAGIYAELDRIEPVDRPGQPVRPRLERYPLPLGAAFAFALLAFALPRRAAIRVRRATGTPA
ncbi:MAG TPA: VWA domain-containing protein [Xanthomonadaceae bacterium]|nr:VWA domain-containing protein [Xanthomonadaceae bacterium]